MKHLVIRVKRAEEVNEELRVEYTYASETSTTQACFWIIYTNCCNTNVSKNKTLKSIRRKTKKCVGHMIRITVGQDNMEGNDQENSYGGKVAKAGC